MVENNTKQHLFFMTANLCEQYPSIQLAEQYQYDAFIKLHLICSHLCRRTKMEPR